MSNKTKNLTHKKVGRKWFEGKDEEKVVAKLKEVWMMGGTDEEASLWAEVSKYSTSRYLQAHPDLAEIRNQLKEEPNLRARKTIYEHLHESETAKWYLERKKKLEFSQRIEQTAAEGEDLFKNLQNDKYEQAIAREFRRIQGIDTE